MKKVIKQKVTKVMKKYHNKNDYIMDFILAGGEVGRHDDKYPIDELVDMLIEITEGIRKRKSLTIDDFYDLLGERGLEFMNDCLDLMLKEN